MQQHLKVSPKGLELTASEEGLRLRPYNDANGFATVGYGHLIRRGPVEPTDLPITEEQALAYLAEDYAVPEAIINRHVTVQLTQNQFDAVADFVFNVGAGNFERSSVLMLLNQSRFDAAAEAFLHYIHDANGDVLNGLVVRRTKEKDLFLES